MKIIDFCTLYYFFAPPYNQMDGVTLKEKKCPRPKWFDS